MIPPLMRCLAALAVAGAPLCLLGGCATVTGDPTQVVHIETLDERGQPIEGMRCRLKNNSSEYFGDSPMFGLEVHRSSSDLRISCRLGDRIAEGRAVSRAGMRGGLTGVVDLMAPGGSAYMVIDHLTGYRYTYPVWMRLQIGQTLVFDASDDDGGKPVAAARIEPREAPAAASPATEHVLVRSE